MYNIQYMYMYMYVSFDGMEGIEALLCRFAWKVVLCRRHLEDWLRRRELPRLIKSSCHYKLIMCVVCVCMCVSVCLCVCVCVGVCVYVSVCVCVCVCVQFV